MAMMERTGREAASGDEPWKTVYLLRQMEEMIDREKQGKEAVGFIAQYLTDRRPTEPLHRGPEAVPREPRRVCDGACSALIHFMEESHRCEMYDSRFGDPGGESMAARRDEVIRAVVKVLQEKELLSADFWSNVPAAKTNKK